MDRPEGCVNTKEAAKILGVTPNTIPSLRKAKKIRGVIIQKKYWYYEADLQKMREKGRASYIGGAAKKCPYFSMKCEGYRAEACDQCPLPECIANQKQALTMMDIDRRRRKKEAKDWKYKHVKKEDLPPEDAAHVMAKTSRRIVL